MENLFNAIFHVRTIPSSKFTFVAPRMGAERKAFLQFISTRELWATCTAKPRLKLILFLNCNFVWQQLSRMLGWFRAPLGSLSGIWWWLNCLFGSISNWDRTERFSFNRRGFFLYFFSRKSHSFRIPLRIERRACRCMRNERLIRIIPNRPSTTEPFTIAPERNNQQTEKKRSGSISSPFLLSFQLWIASVLHPSSIPRQCCRSTVSCTQFQLNVTVLNGKLHKIDNSSAIAHCGNDLDSKRSLCLSQCHGRRLRKKWNRSLALWCDCCSNINAFYDYY